MGTLFESDDTSLYDVLDAESGDLEALYSLYFDDDEDWFKDEFASAAEVDLGYIQELTLDAAWQDRNIDLAVVQRLNETLAAGCKMLVMAVSSEEVARWEQMGFEVPAGEDSELGLDHLNNEGTHPRVVRVEDPRSIAAPHEQDRFNVLSTDDEGVQPSRSPMISPLPTPEASLGRTQDAAARRATAARRPARRRR